MKLDISPISSIMYPEISDLFILPHLSITSNDFTKSVLVCAGCEMKLEDMDGGILYITDISASSVALIKIILALKDIRVEMKQFGAQMLESAFRALFAASQKKSAAGAVKESRYITKIIPSLAGTCISFDRS